MNIDNELIKYFEKQFPDTSPNINDSERTIWFKAGQSSVVKHLLKQKEAQDENILTTKLREE